MFFHYFSDSSISNVNGTTKRDREELDKSQTQDSGITVKQEIDEFEGSSEGHRHLTFQAEHGEEDSDDPIESCQEDSGDEMETERWARTMKNEAADLIAESEFDKYMPKEPEVNFSSYSGRKRKMKVNFSELMFDNEGSDNEMESRPKKKRKQLDIDTEWDEERSDDSGGGNNSEHDNKDSGKNATQKTKKGRKLFQLSAKQKVKTKGKLTESSVEQKAKRKSERPPWISIELEDFSDKYKIETHQSTQQMHRKNDVTETYYVCLYCNVYRAEKKDTFTAHIEEHVNKRLCCSECSYEAKSHKDRCDHLLKSHNIESSRRKHVCHLCGVTYRTGACFYAHLNKDHNQAHSFTCSFCKEKFATHELRTQHRLDIHAEEVKYCKNCESSMNSLTDTEYQEHVKTCPSSIQCDVCGDLVVNKRSAINRHKKKHNKIRSHQCHLCPYTAASKSRLNLHLRTHDGKVLVHIISTANCFVLCCQSLSFHCPYTILKCS